MAWWPFGRNRRDVAGAGAGPAAGPAAPIAAPPVSLAAEPDGAWRDLPSLQRTLAEPLRPVAIGDDFQQSLASFSNPSFVAPLSHQVDPSTGGLVDGLASPGQPYAHPYGSDLPVPARPAASTASRVQRSVAWSGSSDLPTVGWELPGPADGGMLEPSPELPSVTSGGVELTTLGSASVAAPVRGAASAPDRGGASTPRVQVPVQRSLAAVPERPAPMGVVPPIALGELPVVVARSIADSPSPEVRATPGPAEPPKEPEASDSQMIEPVTEHAPLSGFAAAITSLADSAEVPAEPPDGRASRVGTGDRLAVGPAIQRLTADTDAPIGSDITPDAPDAAVLSADPSWPSLSSPLPGLVSGDSQPVSPPLTGPAAVASLPVVSRLMGTAGDPEGRVPDALTLGRGPTPTALAIQRAALTGRTAVSAEPPVQRVEFLTPQIAASPRPTLSRISAAPAGDPQSVARPSTDTVVADAPAVVATPTGATSAPRVQRSRQGSDPSAVPAVAVPGQRSRASFPVAPTAVQRSAEVGLSYEADDATAGFDAASEIGPGPEIAAEPPTGLPDLPAPATSHDHRDLSEPGGPTVTAEPWVPAPAASAHASAAPAMAVQSPSVQRHPTPVPAVQTSLASDPFASAATSSSRPVGSGPTVAVGPPLPVQRSAAHLTEAAEGQSASSSPLIVSRQVAANAPSSSRGGGTMSFANMSALLAAGVGVSSPSASESDSVSATQPTETAATDDDGFTTVQLQADTATAPSEPASEPAAAPASSAAPAPAPAGAAPTDLDEMARRLYEPLSARLRAEFWLDRERAGVMSDA